MADFLFSMLRQQQARQAGQAGQPGQTRRPSAAARFSRGLGLDFEHSGDPSGSGRIVMGRRSRGPRLPIQPASPAEPQAEEPTGFQPGDDPNTPAAAQARQDAAAEAVAAGTRTGPGRPEDPTGRIVGLQRGRKRPQTGFAASTLLGSSNRLGTVSGTL